ncbi:MAG: VWA domain-containing protein [Pirellulaceae bacterium]
MTQSMTSQSSPSHRLTSQRRGAMMVLISVLLIILFVAAAFAIDVAYMHATRAELRTATDAAARAASEALGRLQDTEAAIQAAMDIAAENRVANKPLELAREDIILGTHTIQPDGTFQFTPDVEPFTSIQVRGRRVEGSPSGPVPLFFGPLLGVTEFEPVQFATASRLDRDIALVLDVSGSMRNFGRFDALRNALTVFLIELDNMPQQEVVSLAVYNQNARRVQPMTADLSQIRDAFDEETPGGFTAIGRGMQAGLASIKHDAQSRPFAFKELIVMTDGNHNTGVSPLSIVPEAVAENVIVHTITFSEGANQALMRQVAEDANGLFQHANTDEELIEVFREVALQIPVVLIDY